MVRVMEVKARVFVEEFKEPRVYITFSTRGQARSVNRTLEDATNLGKTLLAKGYYFLPWTGFVFGWRAYRDKAEAQERHCQYEAYKRLIVTV